MAEQQELPTHQHRAELIATRLPGPDEITRVATIFKLLGDPTRTRLLYALLEAGELCVHDLAKVSDATETTISQSLRMLRAHQVVTGRREGRNVFYRLSDSHVRLLLDITREHTSHGADAQEES